MKTIKNFEGVTHYLSDEVYVITNEDHPSMTYRTGAIVHLIGDTPSTVGHHFHKDYQTVCRADTGIAEFCGINKKFLLKLDINKIRIAIDII